ncbi:lysoplasmalogenase [Vibrio hepatarius]|jgi:uncharacterized membrane protein YhhN|uniref:Lysoplasmalogenase n=1 Tax=Vibrio hepatarius TaxID=171383 RepID=A0A0M0I4V7_9VIBR|nr:lysoplasmalogenase [Vibrio hepatarius]KOO09361.1 hypothetical protein AKJ31_03120 [Vibrio hepatarius]
MWLIIVLLCVVHVWSIDKKYRWIFYLSKATPVFLMSALVLVDSPNSQDYAYWIGVGLIASAIGDLFLMHPKDKFIEGLSCFLCAHILYSYAFFTQIEQPLTLWLPAVLFSVGLIVYLLLLPTLDNMKLPVAVYTSAILVMAWGATEVWLEAEHPLAAYGAMGAFIFIVSDLVLAIDRFRTTSAFSRHVVMVTYYTAQVLLTLSALGIYRPTLSIG